MHRITDLEIVCRLSICAEKKKFPFFSITTFYNCRSYLMAIWMSCINVKECWFAAIYIKIFDFTFGTYVDKYLYFVCINTLYIYIYIYIYIYSCIITLPMVLKDAANHCSISPVFNRLIRLRHVMSILNIPTKEIKSSWHWCAAN